MIWTGDEKAFKEFFKKTNKLHNSIKFDCKYSKKERNFLDTTVPIGKNGTLNTKLYQKLTDRNAYLHFNSYHPVKQKEYILFGQFLRAKKICSNDQDAEDSIKGIETKFIEQTT